MSLQQQNIYNEVHTTVAQYEKMCLNIAKRAKIRASPIHNYHLSLIWKKIKYLIPKFQWQSLKDLLINRETLPMDFFGFNLWISLTTCIIFLWSSITDKYEIFRFGIFSQITAHYFNFYPFTYEKQPFFLFQECSLTAV